MTITKNPFLKTLFLLFVLVFFWVKFFHLKQQLEQSTAAYLEEKMCQHQQQMHQEQITTYKQYLENWHKTGKLKVFEAQEAEEFFTKLCQQHEVSIQDVRIKTEEEKSITEYPQFHCSGQISAVLKMKDLNCFYLYINALTNDFPALIVYKTLKVSKIAQSTEWAALIDFTCFNVDLSDYNIENSAPSDRVLPIVPSSTENQPQINEIFDKPSIYLLKAILYHDRKNWTIWLNDKKINNYSTDVSSGLQIIQVTPEKVQFKDSAGHIFNIVPGKSFSLSK